MKQYTDKKASVLAEKLLKAARKTENRKAARAIENAYNHEGKCYIIDGFRGYRLNKRPSGITEIWRAETPTDEEMKNIKKLHDYLVNGLFAPLDNKTLAEMPAPDANAVKSFIKSINNGECTNKSNAFELGDGCPFVNPWYLLDIIELLPGAKWYYNPERTLDPVYAESPDGAAVLLPIRIFNETPAEPDKPETVYVIYAKLPDSKKYYRADLSKGRVGVNALCTPVYPESRLETIKKALEKTASENPGASFQIRTDDGKRAVYTTAMTLTPHEFLKRYAA